MRELAIIVVLGALIILIILSELAAAAIPLLIIVTMVPHDERHRLAELVAATDSSRKLRFWPALKVAVVARRSVRQR
jgi:hypothetical protein